MAWVEEGAYLRRRFLDQWGGETPVAEPNGAFDPDDPDELAANESYVRYNVLRGPARVAGVGAASNRYRHDGDVVIEVFTPANRGDGRSLELADLAASVFRGLQDNGFVFWAPRLVTIGNQKGWYRQNVICPFQHDEIYAH